MSGWAAGSFPSEGCVTVEFTCEDNGIGMSEEFQQHLFEPFAQEADDARTQYQGTGLGLSIVEKLVSAMHGTITFNSQRVLAPRFRVVLPFGIDRTAPHRSGSTAHSRFHRYSYPAGGG